MQADAWLVVLAALLGVFALAVGWRRSALVCIAAAAFVDCAARWSAQLWPHTHDGERVRAQVSIDSLVTQRDRAIEFDGIVTVQHPAALRRTLRARITWRSPPARWPAAGERWHMLLQMRSPLAASRGGRDVARDAFRDDLHALATVVVSPLDRPFESASWGVLSVRARIERALRTLVPEPAAAALFAGLAVGATGGISREQWRAFAATSTTHLVAISGMHVTLFAWIAAALARRLWRASSRLQAVCRREFFAGVLGVSCAATYAALAGFGVPTQRTLVMLACWWWAKLAGREHGGYEVLSLAMLVILMIDPLAPLSSGFWLSFVAMATLLVGDLSLQPHPVLRPAKTGWRRSWDALRGWWQETAQTQWRVTLALAPVTLAWFSGFSLAGLFANFVAIPVFSFVLVPCVLAASLMQEVSSIGARVLLWPARLAWQGLWPMLQRLAELPLANIQVADGAWLWVIATPVVFLWLWPVPWRWRAVTMLCLVPWVWPVRERLVEGTARAQFLAAGDGVAVIVQTRTHALLYDTGEVYGSRGRRVEAMLLPALRERGIDAADLLVIARAGSTNVVGAALLLQHEAVRGVRAGGAWVDPPPRVGGCRARERWSWDGVTFTLFPATTDAAASCVLRIDAGEGDSLLLVERLDAAESRALAEHPLVRRVDTVLAPRRGSPTAASAAFVDASRPHRLIVAASRFDDARRERIARHWQLAPECVVSTAAGSIELILRAAAAGGYSQASPAFAARLWRPVPAVGYDSAITGAETARCGN